MCYILRCNQISQRLYRLTDLIIQQNQRSTIENGIKDLPDRCIKRLRSKLQHPVAWFNIKALFVVPQPSSQPHHAYCPRPLVVLLSLRYRSHRPDDRAVAVQPAPHC